MIERKVKILGLDASYSVATLMQKCEEFGLHPIQAIGTEVVAVWKCLYMGSSFATLPSQPVS